MNKTRVNELNSLLRDEYMAIDAYEKYIQRIDDANVKEELQRIQQDHKLHTIMVSERIQSLGGKPLKGMGLTGKVSETISSIKNSGIHDPVLLLKTAYDGEDNEIKLATEIVKGDLDRESAELIKDILDGDRRHLQTLNSLIQSKGGIS